jgi:hypothetical protein
LRPQSSGGARALASSTRPLAAASPGSSSSSSSAADAAAAAAVAALATYEDAYFNAAAPLISDDAYDALKKASGRKGKGVGAPPATTSTLPKAAHPARLLSLDAVHSRGEAEAWGVRAMAKLKGGDAADTAWAVEPKFDGLAARCSFVGGRLAAVVTRGDGRVGEDVTPAAAGGRILGLPIVLSGADGGGDGSVHPDGLVALDEVAADEVAGGEVLVAGDGDEGAAEAVEEKGEQAVRHGERDKKAGKKKG